MKRLVLKLQICDDKNKYKAMKTVIGFSGVDSIANDMKGKKFTLTGDIDPLRVVIKLRKVCSTDIVAVWPAKEAEKKKEEPQKVIKIVFKLEIYDDKNKYKAMKTVSGFSGVESIAMDMKDQRMTIVGDIDPIAVAVKLRKRFHAELVTYQDCRQQLQPPPTYYYSRSVEEDQNSCGLNTSIKLQVDLDLDSDSDSETPSLCASLTLSPCVNGCFCLSACLSSLSV